MMFKKTTYDNGFKAKVTLEAIRGDKTIAEVAAEFNVASSLVSKWKRELLSNAANVFGAGKTKSSEETEHRLYQ